jgi:uracil-DNA glycosylase
MSYNYIKGWPLAYFQSGEWQVVKERMHDKARNLQYCPDYAHLFDSLRCCALADVRVAIMGQDPYPNPDHACGIAFAVPGSVTKLPASLVNIYKEYSSDLHYPTPKNGDLSPWTKQGVLLWNVYPSCYQGRPASNHWDEWTYLTKEIVEKLDEKGKCVFVFLGRIAADFSHYVKSSPTIVTSHPSPLGANKGFLGSQIFTRTNRLLRSINQETINWRLPCSEGKPLSTSYQGIVDTSRADTLAAF